MKVMPTTSGTVYRYAGAACCRGGVRRRTAHRHRGPRSRGLRVLMGNTLRVHPSGLGRSIAGVPRKAREKAVDTERLVPRREHYCALTAKFGPLRLLLCHARRGPIES